MTLLERLFCVCFIILVMAIAYAIDKILENCKQIKWLRQDFDCAVSELAYSVKLLEGKMWLKEVSNDQREEDI